MARPLVLPANPRAGFGKGHAVAELSWRYAAGVNSRFHPFARFPRVERWVVGVAWLLIIIKCFVVVWAIRHYQVPIHPFWIIGPTLAFAGVATSIWLAHEED
jgi:hypothetical protein